MVKTTHVNLGENSYDIFIGKGILAQSYYYLSKVYTGKKIAIVTDKTVYSLYGETLKQNLLQNDLEIEFIVLEPGEKTKSIENLSILLSRFAQFKLTRKDLIIAFGGGVIGDLTGFAASCYMRGVKFVQIPTTLLSQVDSSVGGKTAVNLKEGKNLVGAFWQPKQVIIDTDVLDTLNDREFASGMAEVIKYGAIFSAEFFKLLQQHNSRQSIKQIMPQIIENCCNLKRIVVEKDEKDTGERMLLNFGHTFGHTIETLGNYTDYTHGEAVAIGMCIACQYGEMLKITKAGTTDEVKKLCLDFMLPCNDEIPYNKITPLVSIDKKAENSNVNLILINEIGESIIKLYSLKEFSENMQQGEQIWM